MRAPGFADVLRSEWLKFRSLRAPVLTAAGALAAGIGYGILFGLQGARQYLLAAPADQAAFDPYEAVSRPLLFVQVILAAMGALIVTSEYRSGMMPVSVTAVPGRGRLLMAKAVVAGVAGLAVGAVTAVATFLTGHAVLAAGGAPSLTLADPGVPGALTGTALYLAMATLLGVATGTLVRASAGAVSLLAVGMVLVPAMASVYPEWLSRFVLTFWPTVAGMRITALRLDPRFMAPLPGFVLLCGFVAVMVGAALWAFRSRDV
ncbi:ABC transporter permease subunit [Spongiactinospora sp. TRM90649]|uniref:ABC transporter permease subunit n=1 Tax=Spongiactinospora sp. TRM90649 TaxID=3031114 RepID=UPI0023F6E802|nr:ABC transporter permease subunit [Spongiactinospora sp. TRM90649]MDF5753897.1 ABC transporter permease subunit [Spongiactinospora sp. TRM90649]